MDALPSNLLTRLQEQFKQMLQNIDLEDHVANLLCLAVLAVMTLTPSAASILEHDFLSRPGHQSSSTTENPESYNIAQQYFVSKRTTKTLDFVVLKLIFACSKSCNLSTTEIIESLQLSITIIGAVDNRDRQQWMSEVVCTALQFISTLLGDRLLPQELTPICKAVLCASSASKLPRAVCVKILAKEQLLLDESSIQDQLLRILQKANHTLGNVHTLSDVDAALVLVESFATSVEYSAPLRQKLLFLLSANVLAEPLKQFLDLTQAVQLEGLSHDHIDFCPCLYAERLVTLQQKVSILFLKTALFSQSDSLSLDASLGSALIEKKIALDTRNKCGRYMKGNHGQKPSLVGLFEAGGTPDSRAGSEHWRERIKNDLAHSAEHQYQTIVRTMGETCEDLERRCNEVERPLREEQAKSRQLHDKLEESRVRVAELESRNHEQSLYLEGVEHEKSELEGCVKHVKNERESLSDQVEGLLQALHEASHKADFAADSSVQRIKELELIHAATIAEKDEELDTQRQIEQELKIRVENLETDATITRENASAASKEVTRLNTTISEQRTGLEEANAVIDKKQAECDKQMELVAGLEAEKKDLHGQLQELSNSCLTLKTDMEARTATIEDQSAQLGNAHRKYEAELSAQNLQMTQLRQSSDQHIHDLEFLLQEQTEKAAQAAKESSTKIRRLESRLVKLTEEIENRENELEEAQGLTNQVMAFWNKQRRRNTAVENPLIIPDDGQLNNASNTPPALEPAIATWSRETPPEAKRTRTHQHFSSRRSAVDKARSSIDIEPPAVHTKATSGRQPLQDLDVRTQERSNVTSKHNKAGTTTSKTPSVKDIPNENSGLERAEGSFCDSDFFASADQQLIAGIHAKEAQEASDDTTMEF
ncbi:MAG: hypothetical protein Q9225_006613 [Loekoesia sp. 1 TL-2023]